MVGQSVHPVGRVACCGPPGFPGRTPRVWSRERRSARRSMAFEVTRSSPLPLAPSQYVIPISRYIVVAVLRCSLRGFALALAPGESPEAEVAVGDEGAHPELRGERERLTIVAVSASAPQRSRWAVTSPSEGGPGPRMPRCPQPAGEGQASRAWLRGLGDPRPARQVSLAEQKNEPGRPSVMVATVSVLDGARDQRDALPSRRPASA